MRSKSDQLEMLLSVHTFEQNYFHILCSDNCSSCSFKCFFSKVHQACHGEAKKKLAKLRNRYNLVPRLTNDTTWESDKNTIKHHKREPRGI